MFESFTLLQRYHAASRWNVEQLTRLSSSTYKYTKYEKIWTHIHIHNLPHIYIYSCNSRITPCIWCSVGVIIIAFGMTRPDQTIVRLHIFNCEIVTFILEFIVLCSGYLINFHLAVTTCAIRWNGGFLWDEHDDLLNEFH